MKLRQSVDLPRGGRMWSDPQGLQACGWDVVEICVSLWCADSPNQRKGCPLKLGLRRAGGIPAGSRIPQVCRKDF